MQIFYRRVYAVEVNPYCTRVVIIKKRGKKLTVMKKLRELPSRGPGGASLDDQFASLRKMVETAPSDVEDLIVVNYPFGQTLYERYSMPKLTKDQLKGAIQFKLSEEFSVPSQNIVLDFGEGLNATVGASTTNYFVYAAKKAYFEPYIQSLITQGGIIEPDIVMPDILKYLEIIDLKTMGIEELAATGKIHFLVCVDLEYSALFVFKGKEVVHFMEIPISLNRLIADAVKAGLDRDIVLDSVLSGAELGSLGYTKDVLPLFENFYKLVSFESDKVMRQYLNTLNESDPLDKVAGIFFCSINQRVSLDIEANARDIRILDGILIKRTAIRKDIPEEVDSFRTTVGIGLRGVNTLGRSQFIQKKKG